MSVTRLPPRLDVIPTPSFISPSSFAEYTRCALRATVHASSIEGALPPSSLALHGTLIHHVRAQLREGRWGSSEDAIAAADAAHRNAAEQLDRWLASDARTARRAPLRRDVGRARWNDARAELMRWSIRQRVRPAAVDPDPLPNPLQKAELPPRWRPDHQQDVVELGTEPRVVCRALRLSGRPDAIERVGGEIHIADHKTGAIFDDDDHVRDEPATQVRLYALAVEGVLGTEARIKLYLESDTRVPVGWNAEIRETTRSRLARVLELLPANTFVAASTLANPGTTCVGCRLRPVCPGYLDAAPRWWPNGPDAVRPIPMDVWGRILDLEMSGSGYRVDLSDAAKRLVRVDGILPEVAAGLEPGLTAYFFDLEPSEPTRMHAREIHPRNFHQLPDDRSLVHREARSLQVYLP